jgi:hypothetical protein
MRSTTSRRNSSEYRPTRFFPTWQLLSLLKCVKFECLNLGGHSIFFEDFRVISWFGFVWQKKHEIKLRTRAHPFLSLSTARRLNYFLRRPNARRDRAMNGSDVAFGICRLAGKE